MPTLKQNNRIIDARAKPFTEALTRWLTKFGRLAAREAETQIRQLRSKVGKASEDDELAAELSRILSLYGLRQIDDAGKRVAGSKWAVPPSAIEDFVNSKEIKIQGIMKDTREAVRDSVRRLILDAQNEDPVPSAGELARRIRSQYHGPPDGRVFLFSSERAATIARTELVQAENTGIVEGYRATGVDQIEWLAYTDGKSGDRHHEEMKGVRIKLGDMFETPLGNKLRYPGDPMGPIEDTINCRCTVAPVRT